MTHPTLSIFCPPDTPRAASKAELVAGKLEQLPAATSPEAAEEIAASLFAILEADEIEAGAKRLKIRRK